MDDRRRQFLVRALSAGCLLGAGARWPAWATPIPGAGPALPPPQSVYQLQGEVMVNRRPATLDTVISAGDKIETGPASSIVAVIGADAFMLRPMTRIDLAPARAAKQGLRLISGGLLAVFGRRGDELIEIATPVATIGIRGTGLYAEVLTDRSYVCTCYGTVDIMPSTNPEAVEQVRAVHHDAPRWVLSAPQGGRHVIPAPMLNHNDMELEMLEALVGRSVPFGPEQRILQSPQE